MKSLTAARDTNMSTAYKKKPAIKRNSKCITSFQQ